MNDKQGTNDKWQTLFSCFLWRKWKVGNWSSSLLLYLGEIDYENQSFTRRQDERREMFSRRPTTRYPPLLVWKLRRIASSSWRRSWAAEHTFAISLRHSDRDPFHVLLGILHKTVFKILPQHLNFPPLKLAEKWKFNCCRWRGSVM